MKEISAGPSRREAPLVKSTRGLPCKSFSECKPCSDVSLDVHYVLLAPDSPRAIGAAEIAGRRLPWRPEETVSARRAVGAGTPFRGCTPSIALGLVSGPTSRPAVMQPLR